MCSAGAELSRVRLRSVCRRPRDGGRGVQRGPPVQATPVVSPVQQVATLVGPRRCRRRLRADAVVNRSAHQAHGHRVVCRLADAGRHRHSHCRCGLTQRSHDTASDDCSQLRRLGLTFDLLSHRMTHQTILTF